MTCTFKSIENANLKDFKKLTNFIYESWKGTVAPDVQKLRQKQFNNLYFAAWNAPRSIAKVV